VKKVINVDIGAEAVISGFIDKTITKYAALALSK
jgi:hypothetical protein